MIELIGLATTIDNDGASRVAAIVETPGGPIVGAIFLTNSTEDSGDLRFEARPELVEELRKHPDRATVGSPVWRLLLRDSLVAH